MTPPNFAPSTALQTDVLIVDDEPQIGRVLGRALIKAGLTVMYVKSAIHARRALERATYRVVLTDQRMRGGDGSDLLSEVAELWPEVRRILMSAVLDAELLTACPGAHRAIDKSFPLSEIVRIIKEEVVLATSP